MTVMTHYLEPGEAVLSDKPARVVTILGSCVSMTMYSPEKCFGGIFHAVLPSKDLGRNYDAAQTAATTFRYVDSSIQKFMMILDEKGIQRDSVQIKLFGGAMVLPGRPYDPECDSVGKRNVLAAYKVLKEMGLRVTKSDVGGDKGRKIVFDMYSGDVWLKRVQSSMGPIVSKIGATVAHCGQDAGEAYEE